MRRNTSYFYLTLVLCFNLISCVYPVKETGSDSKRSVDINKIAVIPLFTKPEYRNAIPVERNRFLTSELYHEMNNKIKGITIVALGSSTEEFMTLKEENPGLGYVNLALEVGRNLNSDAILIGNISAFREREGGELGTPSPASVAFEVQLLNPVSGVKIWEVYYAETQEDLFQNVTKIGKFFKRKGKWVTANQLAKEGVVDVVDNLAAFLGQP
ncbi:hypothetical protein MYX76_09900 [Desulfobacterota bacterium AH_259_B03_O07]|nr:hypothetical protein [Desulfobacterota bacterium AH_259_B03_O07]